MKGFKIYICIYIYIKGLEFHVGTVLGFQVKKKKKNQHSINKLQIQNFLRH